MGPMSGKRRHYNASHESVGWLPFDSRLFSPIFSFGRVKGIARVFLIIEMILTVLVIAGTFVLVGLHLAR